MPFLSIVMCSRDDERFARSIASYERALGGADYEVVRISDARGMCEGLNRGVAQARGERLILSHDDVEIMCDDFAEKLSRRLDRYDIVGFCGTTRLVGPAWHLGGPPWVFGQVLQDHGPGKGLAVDIFNAPARTVPHAQAIDGALMAVRREVFRSITFDEATFPGWHLYDMDFSYRAHLAGFNLAIACDFDVFHYTPAKNQYQTPEWQLPAQKFYEKHKQTLPPLPDDWINWSRMVVYVRSLEEAVMVMRPPHFDPAWLQSA